MAQGPTNFGETKHWLRTARTLTEALPYMRRYAGKTFVIKYGGHAMGDAELADIFARDIVLLKQVGIHPVVVHGGGPQINAMLKRLNVKSTFVQGLRVTDEEMLDVVEMVLAGPVNKQVAEAITRAGALAVGISGKDGGLIRARKLQRTYRDPDSNIEKVLDLGFVGEPASVDPKVLHLLIGADIVPVVAPGLVTVVSPPGYALAWAAVVTALDAVVVAVLLRRGATTAALWWLAFLLALGPVALGRLVRGRGHGDRNAERGGVEGLGAACQDEDQEQRGQRPARQRHKPGTEKV